MEESYNLEATGESTCGYVKFYALSRSFPMTDECKHSTHKIFITFNSSSISANFLSSSFFSLFSASDTAFLVDAFNVVNEY